MERMEVIDTKKITDHTYTPEREKSGRVVCYWCREDRLYHTHEVVIRDGQRLVVEIGGGK